jgi:hypothetical protein
MFFQKKKKIEGTIIFKPGPVQDLDFDQVNFFLKKNQNDVVLVKEN